MQSFLARLRERKLVHWAAAYLAGAWLLLQVLDILAQPFAWPDLVMRAATVLLAVGFLAALVLAWYHGERGAQRVSGVELLMLAGILVIAAAAVGFVGGRGPVPAALERAASTATAEQGSIAVLPFADMSAERDQEYFADGLTEELLNVLAQLPGLRVASRTSSFSFKGSAVAIDSIARALHVAHVLEGSVRKEGDRLRITAQLINATDGYHLWSDTYDRDVGSVFAVQDEIAHAIVDALELRLGGAGARAALARQETRDPEAHTLVLKAAQGGRADTPESLAQAVSLLQQALARDPEYARAHALLARIYLRQVYNGFVPADEFVPRVRRAAARAQALDPLGRSRVRTWPAGAGLRPGLPRGRSAFPAGPRAEPQPGGRALEPRLAADAARPERGGDRRRGARRRPGPARPRPAHQPRLDVRLRRAPRTRSGGVPHLAGARGAPHHLGQPGAIVRRAGTGPGGHGGGAARGRARLHTRVHSRTLRVRPRPRRPARRGRTPHPRARTAVGLLLRRCGLGGAGRARPAFALLDKAVQAREPGVADMGVDPAFARYRHDPRMQALLRRLGLR